MSDFEWCDENAKLQAVVDAAKRHIRTCVMHTGGGPTELHKALAALEDEYE